jgi:pyridoxal phosphate enzyme (YggS family)
MLDAAAVGENLARIRALVGPDVEILAATKYVEADDLPALHAAGVTLVGENRTDSLIPKQERFGDLFTWDFIGHVQSRKVRDIVGRVRLIHAVDSLSTCEQLERRRAPGSTIDCLLQVNVAGEDTKSGVLPAGVDAFLESVAPLAGVRFRGLMTMPPAVSDPEHARPWFAALREVRDRLAPAWRGRHEFDHLSMGTSQDFAVAAQEGATIVRVGGVLYGR